MSDTGCVQAYIPRWYDKLCYKIHHLKNYYREFKFSIGKKPKCSYVEHAKREFLALGYKPIEQEDDGPNKWIQENIFELLETLGKQGHSGTSIHFVVDYFKKLALFEPLCPLTGEDNEWICHDYSDTPYYQNNRCSHVFKDSNGIAYDTNAYVFYHWSERDLYEGEEGFPGTTMFKSCFTSNYSPKPIEFPYTPKTEYVEVECFEVNKDTNEPEKGSGWWETIYPDYVEENHKILNKLRGRDVPST